MDRVEYLILEYAVTGKVPLSWLTAENIGELLNKPAHGLSNEELISTVYHMLQVGDIRAWWSGQHDVLEGFVPSVEDTSAALLTHYGPHEYEKRVYYGLTAQGGAKWEAAAHPDWSRYIFDSYGDDENGKPEVEVTAMNRELVERYVHVSSQQLFGNIPIADTVVWDVLQPWNVAYWKTLPIGYRIRFNCIRNEEQPSSPFDYEWFEEQHRSAQEWSKMVQWYTRPDF